MDGFRFWAVGADASSDNAYCDVIGLVGVGFYGSELYEVNQSRNFREVPANSLPIARRFIHKPASRKYLPGPGSNLCKSRLTRTNKASLQMDGLATTRDLSDRAESDIPITSSATRHPSRAVRVPRLWQPASKSNSVSCIAMKRSLERRKQIDCTEDHLGEGPSKDIRGMEALHLLERCANRPEPVLEHIAFVSGERLD